ncbi:MAG: class I SAM-dependent methyltransferase [Candidatus Schekmanbacteria bacterium]|nr:class I SAM-dependent methyltransferase [Candidatus Schekmanbacteria bacterium]
MTSDPTQAADALRTFRSILLEIRYDDINRAVRTDSYFGEPFVSASEAPLVRHRLAALGAAAAPVVRLLLLGDAVPAAAVRAILPQDVMDSLAGLSLLSAAADHVRAPYAALASLDGQYFWANRQSPETRHEDFAVYLGADSYRLAHHIPALPGRRVLDLCCGSGFLAIRAAARRGVAAAVGLEIEPRAVAIARVNAMLNGLDDIVSFRESDGCGALAAGEHFDLIACNAPYVPMAPDLQLPVSGHGGSLGLDFIARFLDELPAVMTEGAQAIFVIGCLGTAQGPVLEDLLATHLREHPDHAATLVLGFRGLMDDAYLRQLTVAVTKYGASRQLSEEEIAAKVAAHFAKTGLDFVYPRSILIVDRSARAERRGSLTVARAYNPWDTTTIPRWSYVPSGSPVQAHALNLISGGTFSITPQDAPFFATLDGKRSVAELVSRSNLEGSFGRPKGDRSVLQILLNRCYELEVRGAIARVSLRDAFADLAGKVADSD